MTDLRTVAQQALVWIHYTRRAQGIDEPAEERALRAALAEPQEPDLSRCPKCNGPADNGHDREVPPNPYFCTKCMAEPVAWRWGYRSVTTGEMDWRGYVEIAAHPNLRSPEIITEPLYVHPPQPAQPVQQALVEADRIMGHDDEATEWRERWAHLFGVAGSATSPWRESAAQGCSPRGSGMQATPPQRKPETVQEPVFWTTQSDINWARDNQGHAGSFYANKAGPNDIGLYTAPAQADQQG